jgi:hypothetical protein
MTLAIFIVVFSAIALIGFFLLVRGHLFRGRSLEELAAGLQPIDINAFRNLIDNREEQFLWENLPSSEFRRIHRERMRAAIDYIRAASQNAGILVRLAQSAKEASDPEVVTAAENLLENAIRLRLYALQTIPRLYWSMLLPGVVLTGGRFADDYDTMKRQMTVLACMQSLARGVSDSA